MTSFTDLAVLLSFGNDDRALARSARRGVFQPVIPRQLDGVKAYRRLSFADEDVRLLVLIRDLNRLMAGGVNGDAPITARRELYDLARGVDDGFVSWSLEWSSRFGWLTIGSDVFTEEMPTVSAPTLVLPLGVDLHGEWAAAYEAANAAR